MVYYKTQRHPTKGHIIIPICISGRYLMPSEDHHMPQETHAHLLRQGGNTHMPIQAYEVAWSGKDSKFVTRVRIAAMILVAVITIVVLTS